MAITDSEIGTCNVIVRATRESGELRNMASCTPNTGTDVSVDYDDPVMGGVAISCALIAG